MHAHAHTRTYADAHAPGILDLISAHPSHLGPTPLAPMAAAAAAAAAAPLAREECGSPPQHGAERIEIAASPLFEAARRAARRGGVARGGGAAGAATAWPPPAPRIDEADEARLDEDGVLRAAGPCSGQVETNRSC